MDWMKPHSKGTILHLYIQPGASSTQISGVHGGRLKIKVKAPPRDGEANDALIDFLAEILKIPKSRVHLARGETSRQKDLIVEQTIQEVEAKLTFSIT